MRLDAAKVEQFCEAVERVQVKLRAGFQPGTGVCGKLMANDDGNAWIPCCTAGHVLHELGILKHRSRIFTILEDFFGVTHHGFSDETSRIIASITRINDSYRKELKLRTALLLEALDELKRAFRAMKEN
jgi:hypothetical protein